MTSSSSYRPRRPPSAPTAGDLAERDAFKAMVAQSLPTVRASAQVWRNGLTAFVTLVTTGVIIRGRDATAGLPTSWRVALTVLVGGGIILAVVGLWNALAAEAGTHGHQQTLAEIHDAFGSVAAYEMDLAARAAGRLRQARVSVALALAFLITGIIVTWWAPT